MSDREYDEDRAMSDRYIPAIKRIVGPHLLTVASFELDAKQATDLHVFQARDMRIAARVRNKGYAEDYPYDVTFRAQRDSGTKTELSKIVDGWGDWFFYGHAVDETNIGLWWLIDLHSFRAALIRRDKHPLKPKWRSNKDGTHFAVFDVRLFPSNPSLIIASSGVPEDHSGDFGDDFGA